MNFDLEAHMRNTRSSKIPLTVILSCLRLGLPLSSPCFVHNQGLLGKIRLLLQYNNVERVRDSVSIEPWVVEAVSPFLLSIQPISRTVSIQTYPAPKLVPVPTAAQVLDGDDVHFLPYSRAQCWAKQKAYYSDAALHAWNGANAPVPLQISSNLFVAELYLRIIVFQLMHVLKNKDMDHGAHSSKKSIIRVNIVEVAAGHGILSILLARLLQHKSLSTRIAEYQQHSAASTAINIELPDVQACVVCSDFHTSVFEQLLALPWVQNLCSVGLLDFCAIDADSECDVDTAAGEPVTLLASGKVSSIPCELLVVVAQYAFDSLASDIFVEVRKQTHTHIHTGKGSSRGNGNETEMWEIGVMGKGKEKEEASMEKEDRPNLLKRSRERRGDGQGGGRPQQLVACRLDPRSPTYTCFAEGHSTQGQGRNCDHARIISVPTAGQALLRRVSKAFPVVDCVTSGALKGAGGNVLLLAGDYFVEPDDALWQGRQVDAALQCVSPSVTYMNASTWLDLPEISPRPEIVALPVCVEGLWHVFSNAFPTPAAAAASSMQMNMITSPLCASCFSVGIISNGNLAKEAIRPLLFFGPNDYQTLREYIHSNAAFRNCVSVQYLQEFLLLGSRSSSSKGERCGDYCELGVFLELRWTILRACAREPDNVCEAALLWFVDLAMVSYEKGFHSWVTWKDARTDKCKLMQWLLAVSSQLKKMINRVEHKSHVPLMAVLQVVRPNFLRDGPHSLTFVYTYVEAEAHYHTQRQAQEVSDVSLSLCSSEEIELVAMALLRLPLLPSSPSISRNALIDIGEVKRNDKKKKRMRYIYSGGRRAGQVVSVVSAMLAKM